MYLIQYSKKWAMVSFAHFLMWILVFVPNNALYFILNMPEYFLYDSVLYR